MRLAIALTVSAFCLFDVAADEIRRPHARQMPQAKEDEQLRKIRLRAEWRAEVEDWWVNNQWFIDAMDRYAKTGVEPKIKTPRGCHVAFARGADEKQVRKSLIGIGGNHVGKLIESRRRGKIYVAGAMWMDGDIVTWDMQGHGFAISGRGGGDIDSR